MSAEKRDIVERAQDAAGKIGTPRIHADPDGYAHIDAAFMEEAAAVLRESADEITSLRSKLAEAREALAELVDALDAVDPHMKAVCQIAWLHGQEYSGPTYEHELIRARAALAKLQED